MTKALLVIDVQNLLIEEKPYDIAGRLDLWEEAIATCRDKGIEVIYVRHNDEEFVTGTSGWQIADRLAPQAGEKIIDKRFNSAFKGTDLQAYLQEQGIGQLLLAGMATDYCIDATVKVGFELGYGVSVLKDGTTTGDKPQLPAELLVSYYEQAIWPNFAKVTTLDDWINEE